MLPSERADSSESDQRETDTSGLCTAGCCYAIRVVEDSSFLRPVILRHWRFPAINATSPTTTVKDPMRNKNPSITAHLVSSEMCSDRRSMRSSPTTAALASAEPARVSLSEDKGLGMSLSLARRHDLPSLYPAYPLPLWWCLCRPKNRRGRLPSTAAAAAASGPTEVPSVRRMALE
jgi:hypothetical protein